MPLRPYLISLCVSATVFAALYAGGWLRPPAKDFSRMDGRPNLNGVWQALTPANYDIEPHDPRAAMAFRPGPVRPVPAKEVIALGAVGAVPAGLGIVEGGEIPYTPAALKKRDENRDNWLKRDPEIKCFLPGIPRANYMPFPFQILQSGNSLLFVYEYAGAVRNIFFGGHEDPPVNSWMGHSVGRWEDDALVVTVTHQNGETWLDRAGNFHSDKLKVTERFTPLGPNVLRYEATLEDPEVYTKPFKIALNLYRRVGKDARLLQFKCTEFVEELMYGHLRKEPVK